VRPEDGAGGNADDQDARACGVCARAHADATSRAAHDSAAIRAVNGDTGDRDGDYACRH
jgi:hypothetical protein